MPRRTHLPNTRGRPSQQTIPSTLKALVRKPSIRLDERERPQEWKERER